jgi:hypothetical protein
VEFFSHPGRIFLLTLDFSVPEMLIFQKHVLDFSDYAGFF